MSSAAINVLLPGHIQFLHVVRVSTAPGIVDRTPLIITDSRLPPMIGLRVIDGAFAGRDGYGGHGDR